MELIDAVAAKFHEEPGVFKLLVRAQNLILFFIIIFFIIIFFSLRSLIP